MWRKPYGYESLSTSELSKHVAEGKAELEKVATKAVKVDDMIANLEQKLREFKLLKLSLFEDTKNIVMDLDEVSELYKLRNAFKDL